jgi:P27 family predicted phage terminase small subunit
LNHDEPTPPPLLPDPPSDLKGDALTEWNARGPELLAQGLITVFDVPAFEGYCRAWGRYKNAEEQIARLGEIVKAPSGYPIMNPYMSVLNKALTDCRRFWQEFGMTPASRSRVKVPKGAAPPQSKLNQFMKRAAK